MSVDSKDPNFVYVPKIDLIACPFVNICQLPKHHFLYKVPDCRVSCSEYLAKVRKLRRTAFL